MDQVSASPEVATEHLFPLTGAQHLFSSLRDKMTADLKE